MTSPFNLVCQVFDNYAVTVMIGGEPYTLGLFDTAGRFLRHSLIETAVCFSAVGKVSNLSTLWLSLCRAGGL